MAKPFYTVHVYDKDGLPDETSKLDCAGFATLEEAKKAALGQFEAHGGIVDITEDCEDWEDPTLIWSSDGWNPVDIFKDL